MTYVEALMAVGLVGVLAALTVPTLISSSADKKAVASAKNTTSQLMDARNQYRDSAPDPTQPPTATQLAGFTKYANVTTNCGGTITPSRPLVFGGASDCYNYPDGSVLEAEQAASGNMLQFNFYPKGINRGDIGVSIRFYYTERRVTTLGADTNNPNADPRWAKEWTKFN